MPLTSPQDIKLLEKLAAKRGHPGDIIRIRKLVSSHATRHHISSAVALAFLVKEAGHGTAVYEKRLDDQQKAQLREIRQKVSAVNGQAKSVGSHYKSKKKTERKIEKIIEYDTSDSFIKGHIDEVNRAYSYACYTSAFILARKIIENLIIDILKKKYPENNKEHIELYFDTGKARLKDFGDILSNLRKKKNDFGTENKAVERLCNLAKKLKDNTNDKTHSWYHLVRRKREIDDLDLPIIIELIKKIEIHTGMR